MQNLASKESLSKKLKKNLSPSLYNLKKYIKDYAINIENYLANMIEKWANLSNNMISIFINTIWMALRNISGEIVPDVKLKMAIFVRTRHAHIEIFEVKSINFFEILNIKNI